MIKPWLIMYHTWRRARNWEKWASEQLTRIARADIPCPILISNADNENQTLNRLLECVRSGAPIDGAALYLHQKGISHQQSQEVQDHREMLEYFLIDGWRNAIAALDEGLDAVGCNLEIVDDRYPDSWHFAGNFWWARAAHIARLEPIPADAPKGASEGWIRGDWKDGICQANLGSLHDSGVDHYFERYQPERYR